MTKDRRSKRAIRTRMAATGERYTEARRALLASRGGGGGEHPGVSMAWPAHLLGLFTDQAYNAILLADDEARMLSHARVDPEHLLLAAARRGNVADLLAGEGVDARAIHDLILRIRASGPKLQLRPRPSPRSGEVLRRAVAVAAARGVLDPSSEHLLLAVGEEALPGQILRELGVADVEALVDAHYPVTRPAVDEARVQRRAAELATHGRTAPSPGPIPPTFERFTSQARAAVDAGIRTARQLNDPYVEPVHLLFGVLHARTGVVAALRSRSGWAIPGDELLQPRCSEPADRGATDIFSRDARRIVAEDVLIIAERLGHRSLSTGHLLIAMLANSDDRSSEIMTSLPDVREVTEAVIDALPGEEES
jgi:ATP-dependent Clp protease ATP-binding subunit ClpA